MKCGVKEAIVSRIEKVMWSMFRHVERMDDTLTWKNSRVQVGI